MSRPVTVYEPPALRRLRPLAALRRLREHGDLLLALSLHRVRVRYKQSRLGILWAVLQPLAMMLVFTLMFTFLRAAPGSGIPFPLFAYAALVPWTMFASGLTSASGALTSHASLLDPSLLHCSRASADADDRDRGVEPLLTDRLEVCVRASAPTDHRA